MKLFVPFCLAIVLIPSLVVCSESIWSYRVTEKTNGTYVLFSNYMYKDAFITVHVLCGDHDEIPIKVSWILEEVECMEQMYRLPNVETSSTILNLVPWLTVKKNNITTSNVLSRQYSAEIDPDVDYRRKLVQVSQVQSLTCGKQRFLSLKDEADKDFFEVFIPKDRNQLGENKTYTTPVKTLKKTKYKSAKKQQNRVVRVWGDGMYHFSLSITGLQRSTSFSAIVRVEMKGDYGYLPAILWPQYPYFGIMSVAYLMVGSFWIMLWARAHQHSAKIHLVIGALAAAGSLSNTLEFVDMNSVNDNGFPVSGMKWFTRLLQSIQDSHTQLLLMIVSTGYGITRPKLSTNLLVFVLILTYACLILEMSCYVFLDEDLRVKYNHPTLTAVGVAIPYFLCLAVIGGWIMISSIMTFLHLLRRRHSRKIRIFCVFMAACIEAFIAALIVAGLSYGWLTSCRKNWKMEWFVQNFNKVQQLMLLLVLMWLWRPADPAQSYAFNPLSTDDGSDADVEDEEDDDDDHGEINRNDIKPEKIEMQETKFSPVANSGQSEALVRTTC